MMIFLYKKIYNILFSIILSICCISCNLRPLYKNTQTVDGLCELSLIEVQKIHSIPGVEFANHLLNLLQRDLSTTPKYILKVHYSTNKLPSIIQKNSDVLWEIINYNVSYQLINIKSKAILTAGSFSQSNSYSIGSMIYSNYISNEQANEDIMRHVAEQIFARLSIFFYSK